MTVPPVVDQSKFNRILDAEKTARSLITEQDNVQALVYLSEALELAHQELLAKLYLSRATVHRSLGQHELALTDAKQVIHHYPTSPFGYLQLADTYLSTKDYRAAFLAACNGEKIAKRDDPAYSLLANKKQWIQNEIYAMNSKQLNRLPQELYRDIFLPLSYEDRFKCLYLCKAWRDILNQWSGLWQNAEIGDTEAKKQAALVRFLGSKGMAQHLRLSGVEEAHLIELLCQQGFNQLKTIDLRFCELGKDGTMLLQRLVELNQSTLIGLTSFGNDNKDIIEIINNAISNCERLERLSVSRPIQRRWKGTQLLPRISTKLTHLSLDYTDDLAYQLRAVAGSDILGNLSNILKACPLLQVLVLNPSDLSRKWIAKDALRLIHTHCPKIKQIIICPFDELEEYQDQFLDFSVHPNDTVIRLGNLPGTDKEVFSLLESLRKKLTMLDTPVYGTRKNSEMWRGFARTGGLPNLRDLTLCMSWDLRTVYYVRQNDTDTEEDNDFFLDRPNIPELVHVPHLAESTTTDIIHMSPCLQTIHLHHMNLTATAIFEALGSLKTLRRLKVSKCRGITCDNLRIFWQASSSIQEFIFYHDEMNWTPYRPTDCNEKDEIPNLRHILTAIADSPHKSLRKLELHDYSSYEKEDIEYFAENMKQSKISRITLSCMLPRQELIAPLFTLPSLVHIELHCFVPSLECNLDMYRIMESRQEHICATVTLGGTTYKTFVRGYNGELEIEEKCCSS